MYKRSTIVLFIILILFTACEDKKHPQNKTTTTETFSKEKPSSPLSDTFTLSSLRGEYYTVTVSNQKVTFKESNQGIILLSFFATWCTPCLREIPYLNTLQKQYPKDLFITGVLVHDDIKEKAFNTFIKKHDINYYISNTQHNNDFASRVAKTLQMPSVFSIPLIVMYVDGEYFTHYEGMVPIEMIRYDIEQAQERLK